MKKTVWLWRKRRKLLAGIIILMMVIFFMLIRVPSIHDPLSTVIFDNKGELLCARVAEDGQWRFKGSSTLPEKILKATIAFEDRYFYYHSGFNPVSLFRALRLNRKAGRIVSGGSTITMQTVRLSRKGKFRSVTEKIIEIMLAVRLEISRSKNEILSVYTANAPYGGNVIGIDEDAWRYYGTSSRNLS